MLKPYRADLHIHTCLSPCADLTMSPKRIVERAVWQDLDIIAVCDHNSADNAEAVMAAALGKDLLVLAGMELTTVEEVHLLALFDSVDRVKLLQQKVFAHLPVDEQQEDWMGEQLVVNEFDEVLAFKEQNLFHATGLSLERWISEIHGLNGLAVPAHVDRMAFGLFGQLGFLPPSLNADALEVSANMSVSTAKKELPGIEEYAIITSSDAHYLEDIGTSVTTFYLQNPLFSEIRLAFEGSGGRCCRVK